VKRVLAERGALRGDASDLPNIAIANFAIELFPENI
jgi:hypothetical protein